MGRIPLHGLDHVGDQIISTLELDIDVGPRRLRLLPEFYEGVLETDPDYEDRANRE